SQSRGRAPDFALTPPVGGVGFDSLTHLPPSSPGPDPPAGPADCRALPPDCFGAAPSEDHPPLILPPIAPPTNLSRATTSRRGAPARGQATAALARPAARPAAAEAQRGPGTLGSASSHRPSPSASSSSPRGSSSVDVPEGTGIRDSAPSRPSTRSHRRSSERP